MQSTRVGGAPVTTTDYARISATLLSSFLAAMVGGAVMAVVMIVAFTVFQRTDLLFALRPIGAYLFGDAILLGPTPMMYVGAVAFHFGICALWGFLFAIAASVLRVERSTGGAVLLGVIIGLASQIIDINLVTPPLLFGLWGHDIWTEMVPPLYSWLAHVAFGLSFAVAPALFRPLWRRFGGRDEELPESVPEENAFDDPRIR
ncbi:MAG: hypothetical protein JWN44_6725 [Myxococcales bacterium]|nr:hypothetical protein [Myxococcales bacterium]